MTRIRFLTSFVLISLFFCNLAAITAEDEAPQNTIRFSQTPVGDQIELALELYEEMAEADEWNRDFFLNSHYRVINECPDTPWAIESCWRLSNLLLYNAGHQEKIEIIRLMELALERYPGNPWHERFINRLVNTLKEVNDFQKLLNFCQKQIEVYDTGTDDYLFFALTAGQAAAALGQTDVADWYYSEILRQDANKNSIFAKIADMYLSGSN